MEVSKGTGICLSTDDDTTLGSFWGNHTLRSISTESTAHCTDSQQFSSRAVRNAFPKALETHHRSNKRCIAGRPFKQMRGSTVTRKNDDIETEPLASVDGLDFKNASA